MDFDKLLDENPEDWDLRRIYADWLEDQGEEIKAAGQRWQADNQKRPRKRQKYWTWFSTNRKGIYIDPCSDIPTLLVPSYRFRNGPAARTFNFALYYPDREAAENDLAEALIRKNTNVNRI